MYRLFKIKPWFLFCIALCSLDLYANQASPPKLEAAPKKLRLNVDSVAQAKPSAQAELVKRAELGDTDAQIALGRFYSQDESDNKDVILAEKWFLLAAQQGIPEAEFYLANFHLLNSPIEPFRKSLPWFKKAAKNGHQEAGFVASAIEKNEWNKIQPGAEELTKALSTITVSDPNKLIERSIAQRDESVSRLKSGYLRVLSDLEAAARLGNAEALVLLGSLYRDGRFFERNPELSCQYFKSAAELDYARGQASYGSCLLSGNGVPLDTLKGLHWLAKSADRMPATTSRLIGWVYLQSDDLEGYDEFGIKWIRKAAERGHAKSNALLGQFYLIGKYVNKDLGKAAYWFERAAKAGQVAAQYQLAKTHLDGKFVGSNNDIAFHYFKLAHEGGVALATFELAKIYQEGRVVEKDIDRAFELYLQASRKDIPDAQLALGKMHKAGRGTVKNLKLGKEWIKESKRTRRFARPEQVILKSILSY